MLHAAKPWLDITFLCCTATKGSRNPSLITDSTKLDSPIPSQNCNLSLSLPGKTTHPPSPAEQVSDPRTIYKEAAHSSLYGLFGPGKGSADQPSGVRLGPPYTPAGGADPAAAKSTALQALLLLLRPPPRTVHSGSRLRTDWRSALMSGLVAALGEVLVLVHLSGDEPAGEARIQRRSWKSRT